MIKINVANYIIHDLSQRFPMQSELVPDDDILEVIINRWSNNQYITPSAYVKLNHPQPQNQLLLM